MRANLEEIHLLIDKFSPAAICLQETLQLDNKIINFRTYSHLYHCNPPSVDSRPRGGVSILIDKRVPHSQIKIVCEFQFVAARISLHRPITVCSVYLPPTIHWILANLTNLSPSCPLQFYYWVILMHTAQFGGTGNWILRVN